MKRLTSYEQAERKIKSLKDKYLKIESNCLMPSKTLAHCFDYTDLYYEENSEELLVYVDEDFYFKIYYFCKNLDCLKLNSVDKRILIEELDNGKTNEKRIEELYKLLKTFGFSLESHVSRIYYLINEKDNDIPEQLEDKSIKIIENISVSQFDEIKKLWRENLKEFDVPKKHYNVFDDDSQHLIALEDKEGKVCAASWWQKLGNSMEIRHTVVREDRRGEGLGVFITKLLLKKAYELNIKRVLGYVEEKNVVSKRMHEKVGWIISDYEVWQFVSNA